jgi:hypothetical protein
MLVRPDGYTHRLGSRRKRTAYLRPSTVWDAYVGSTGRGIMKVRRQPPEVKFITDPPSEKVALPLTGGPFSLKRERAKTIYRLIIPMRLRRFFNQKLAESVDIFDYMRTHTTAIIKPSYIRRRWTGNTPLENARRVVVFNHFDKRGIIHEYVEFYLRELRRAGFTIVFTSNSPRFPDKSVEILKPLVAVILWRRNVGYDFGAFKDGIAEIPMPETLDMLLITNDSMYGPLQDLNEIIARANPNEADLWGITDCWDGRFHLQSYFLLFHPQAIRSPAFKGFWDRLPYFRRKRWVVRYGEIGLTPFFLSQGVRCKALFPYRQLISSMAPKLDAFLATRQEDTDPVRRRYAEMLAQCLRNGVPLNQTHFFWDQLVAVARCPFIKRDLLQHNPMAIPYLHKWEQVIDQVSTYDSEMIIKHLQSTMRNKVY